MSKKSFVASLVGNFSPVNKRTAILVSKVRHLRGDMGEVLNMRASELLAVRHALAVANCTILKDSCPIQLEAGRMVCILVLLRVAHLVYAVRVRSGRSRVIEG